MKIAVITAVFGGIDSQKPFCAQSLPDGVTCDRFFYNEANTPLPLPNLPNRLKAKYFKTQSHNINEVSDYDIHVWIDGNIEVINQGFVAAICRPLFEDESKRITIQSHHERSNIEQEIHFIIASDNPYLTVRYADQPLLNEYQHYIDKGMPPTAKLYSCNVFARKVGAFSNSMYDDWWQLCIEWSWFDQSAFSYLAWLRSARIHAIDMGGVTTSPYYTLHGHTQWNQ